MTSIGNKVSGVGIIGAGRASRDHVYAVKNIPELQLIGVADPDEARRNDFAQRHQCDVYEDYRHLLARGDIHLILAGVPHWLHAPLSIDALNAGKHVMVEKPNVRHAVRLIGGISDELFHSHVTRKAGAPPRREFWLHARQFQ
ncbi:TPA: hypothetical protein EYP66_07530 [Candidatus Poribacteria bacterium]|nr:hypothetical protein [Candidatus Poribacteria bacterium]